MNRPKWIPASVADDKIPEFVTEARASQKLGLSGFIFEGVSYKIARPAPAIREATLTDGAKYVFTAPFGFTLQYDDSHWDASEWLEFVRENINNEIPDEIIEIFFGDLKADGSSELEDDDEQDAYDTLHSNILEADGDRYFIGGAWNLDDDDIRKYVATLKKYKVRMEEINDDEDIATWALSEFFGDSNREIETAVRRSKVSYYNDYDESEGEELFVKFEKDFNDAKMEQHFKDIPGVKDIQIAGVDVAGDGGNYAITVETSIPLSDKDLDSLRVYLAGQMSDGIGEDTSKYGEIKLGNEYVIASLDFAKDANKLKLTSTEKVDSDIKKIAKAALAKVHSTIDKTKKKLGSLLGKASKKLSESTERFQSYNAIEVSSLIQQLAKSAMDAENAVIATHRGTIYVYDEHDKYLGSIITTKRAGLSEDGKKKTKLAAAAERLVEVATRLDGLIPQNDNTADADKHAAEIEKHCDALTDIVAFYDGLDEAKKSSSVLASIAKKLGLGETEARQLITGERIPDAFSSYIVTSGLDGRGSLFLTAEDRKAGKYKLNFEPELEFATRRMVKKFAEKFGLADEEVEFAAKLELKALNHFGETGENLKESTKAKKIEKDMEDHLTASKNLVKSHVDLLNDLDLKDIEYVVGSDKGIRWVMLDAEASVSDQVAYYYAIVEEGKRFYAHHVSVGIYDGKLDGYIEDGVIPDTPTEGYDTLEAAKKAREEN